MEYNEIISTLMFAVATVSAIIALKNYRENTIFKKKENLDKIFNDFFDDNHMADIKVIKELASGYVTVPEGFDRKRFSLFFRSPLEKALFFRGDVAERLQKSGMNWHKLESLDNLNDEQHRSITRVLNKMEHLYTYLCIDAISKKDIKLLFKTSLADLFLLTFPYIQFRRQSKSNYAIGCQHLAYCVPRLSICGNKENNVKSDL